VPPLRVIVYSDFLCPWCWSAATRLAAVEAVLGDALALEWRSFLLRPRPQERTPEALERFRAYSRGWLRVAEDEPRAPFRVWASDAGPPTHSLPPHLVAKAAAALGVDAGRRMRERLFRAYFAESRDVSERAVLEALWAEAGLDPTGFARSDDPELVRRTRAEHEEAVACGATGVPAVRLAGQDFALVGAQPEAVYLRWFRRALDQARAADSEHRERGGSSA
jgi:predicted DsbA family dithiol-disulfide isomerase